MTAIRTTDAANLADDTERTSQPMQRDQLKELIVELIQNVNLERQLAVAKVEDWIERTTLSSSVQAEWKRTLTCLFECVDRLATSVGLERSETYRAILPGSHYVLKQLPRSQSFWQFAMQQYRTEYNNLAIAADNQVATSTRTECEDNNQLFVPETSPDITADARTTTNHADFLIPSTPSKNKLGSYSQFVSERYQALKSPEKEKDREILIRKWREKQRVINSLPAAKKRKYQRQFNRIRHNIKIMEQDGYSGTFWAVDAAAQMESRSVHYANYQTHHGSAFHTMMESKGDGFDKWVNTATATCSTQSLVAAGHERPLILQTQNNEQLPELSPSQTDAEVQNGRASTLRDLRRKHTMSKLLSLLQHGVQTVEERRRQEIEGEAGDIPLPSFRKTVLQKWPKVSTFDQEISTRWGLKLYLWSGSTQQYGGLRRADIINAASMMKKKGGEAFRHKLNMALEKGHVCITPSSPSGSSENLQGPDI